MKLRNIFSVAFFVAQLTSATPEPVDDSIEVVGAGHFHKQHLEKRAQANAVTGVRKGYTGDYRVYRQEIRTFSTDKDQRVLDLFLLALERMYSLNRGNPNSYWEIAGVHGRPYQGWNGESATGNRNSGYCTHGSTLFPTWHRPYLAYIEQEIWRNAEVIVNTQVRGDAAFRQQWVDALMVIRLPYWDWAVTAELPPVLTSQTWTFRVLPSGQRNVPRRNPLYAAWLKQGTYNELFPTFPFNTWAETKRYPNGNAPNAPSRNAEVNNQLRANQNNLRQRVYQLLTNNRRWATFSNKVAGDSQQSDSLESIHDVVHGVVGNGGHMSYVDYSSFDPVFFLHHCNIDRLFAIWQVINPNTYVTPQVNNGGTYGLPPGTQENRGTALYPWRGLNTNFWTSDSVRDTSTFGYGYFETPKWRYKNNPTGYANYVRSRVNALYGPQLLTSSLRKRQEIDVSNATLVGIDESVKNNKYYEWRIDVTADKSALDGSYFVHFFLGRPSKNPAEWSSQKELVGDYVIFTHTTQVAPGINPDEVDNKVTGSVPLTDALIKAFGEEGLASLQPEDAAPFLIRKLRWRVSKMDDSKVEPRKVRGLKVAVSRSLVTLPADENGFPEYGTWEQVTAIVRGIKNNTPPSPVGNPVPSVVEETVPSATP